MVSQIIHTMIGVQVNNVLGICHPYNKHIQHLHWILSKIITIVPRKLEEISLFYSIHFYVFSIQSLNFNFRINNPQSFYVSPIQSLSHVIYHPQPFCVLHIQSLTYDHFLPDFTFEVKNLEGKIGYCIWIMCLPIRFPSGLHFTRLIDAVYSFARLACSRQSRIMSSYFISENKTTSALRNHNVRTSYTCKGMEHELMSQTLKFCWATISLLPTSHIATSPVFVPTLH